MPTWKNKGFAVRKNESTEGTAVTPDTSVGFVVGDSADFSEGTEKHIGVGEQEQERLGAIEPSFSLTVEAEDETIALLALQDANGDLTSQSIDVGPGIANGGMLYRGVMIDELIIEAALAAALRYTYGCVAWDAAQSGVITPLSLSKTVLMWYESTVATIGGSSYLTQRLRGTVRNGITAQHSLDGGASGSLRVRSLNEIATADNQVETEVLTPINLSDLGGDTISALAIISTFVDAVGGGDPNDVTHTWSNMTRMGHGFGVNINQLFVERHTWLGDSNALAITITGAD